MFSRKFLFASVAAYGSDLFFTNGMRTVPRLVSFLEAGTGSGKIRAGSAAPDKILFCDQGPLYFWKLDPYKPYSEKLDTDPH
jgi:hypothetical protein